MQEAPNYECLHMKKINILIIVLVLIAGVLQGVNIFLSNKVAADSLEAASLREKIEKLEEKNQLVHAKVLELASLEQIASRAAQLGFVEKDNYISLYSPLEVAVR